MTHPKQTAEQPILITSADVIEDNDVAQPTDEEKRKNALAWGFGIFFAFGGLTCGNPLMALIWFAMSAVLIPPARKKIEEVSGWELDAAMIKKILIGGGVATILLAMMLSAGGGGGASDADWDKWINRVGDIGSPMP